MRLDHRVQSKALCELAAAYPSQMSQTKVVKRLKAWLAENEEEMGLTDAGANELIRFIKMNLNYMKEHELIKAINLSVDVFGIDIPLPFSWAITAKGLDYLEEDGGLSAVFNTVTVKFDVDNIRELVEAGLLSGNVPKEKQSALKKAIHEAPATILQTAISTIVGKGLSDPAGTAKVVAGLFGVSW